MLPFLGVILLVTLLGLATYAVAEILFKRVGSYDENDLVSIQKYTKSLKVVNWLYRISIGIMVIALVLTVIFLFLLW